MEMFEERLDSIEKLLKMLLANSLVDRLDNEIFLKNNPEINMEMKELLKKYGMIITDVESKNGFILVYIETDKSLKLNDYQTLKYKIENNFRMVPVFTFQSLNGMQRKRFIEENISFCIREKEIYICVKQK